MEQPFNADDYVAQEQLLFGLDNIRKYEGLQYADLCNTEIFPHQLGIDTYRRLSTSPEFPLYQQPHIPSFDIFQSPEQTYHGNTSPLFQSPYQPFQDAFEQHNASARDFASSWNQPSHLQMPTGNTTSGPVDIPTRGHQAHSHLVSPTSTGNISHFSNSSWNSSYEMSRTESIPGSVASFGTASEDPMQFARQEIVLSELGSSPFHMIQYKADSAHRLAPTIMPNGKKSKGRRGPLNHAQRISTAQMRHTKACASCRTRKAKCDAGVPCRQCINYYKGNLIYHPCRDQRLEDIAAKVLKGHIFPRRRALGIDFGVNFRTLDQFTVYLSFGFGEPFIWTAQVVSPPTSDKFLIELRHKHVVYKWPNRHVNASERTIEKHWVFPALLTNTASLKNAVNEHLGKLIDNPNNFAQFPNFNSPLVILKDIYRFYRKLDASIEEKPARHMLGQAFKLLNLVQIGGDIRVISSTDSRRIVDKFFSPGIHESEAVPCYMRSQLGEVFSKLANEYMKEVLSALEVECLNKNCARFAVIVSTFIVVFMSIESVQHKTQRDTFHSAHDGDLTPIPALSPDDDVDGLVDLLRFYKNCFAGCHKKRLLSAAITEDWNDRHASPAFKAGEQLVEQLRDAISRAKVYLMERSNESLITSDITVFFDRLVAKLLLLET